MATTHEIKVERREGDGRGASRRLRNSGKVPAIVYGGELAPVSIQIHHNDVWLASQHEWFYSAILDLSLNGDVQKVLLRDMQRHPFKQQLLHLDFQRVDENKKIHMKVPLHFVNAELSPAVKMGGAIVSHVLNEVDVACLPKHLPEFIDVDLANLEIGHSVKVSDLKLPEGLTAVTHGKDPVVATAVVPKAIVETEETAVAEGDAATTAAAPAAGAAPAADAKGAEAKADDKKAGGKDDKKK